MFTIVDHCIILCAIVLPHLGFRGPVDASRRSRLNRKGEWRSEPLPRLGRFGVQGRETAAGASHRDPARLGKFKTSNL